MCGLCGFYSKETPNDEVMQLVTNTFLSIESRGNQASGIAYIDMGGKQIVKNDTPARTFVKSQEYRDFVINRPKLAIFHTRLATNGTVKDNINNHPFKIDGLVWMHNGVIHNHLHLKNQHGLKYSSECDSYIIGALIDKYLQKGMEIVKAIKKTAQQLSGYFAVAVIFKGKLYLFNGGGSLYYTKFGGTLIFASGKKYVFGNEEMLSADKIIGNGEIVEINSKLKIVKHTFKVLQDVQRPMTFAYADEPIRQPINRKTSYNCEQCQSSLYGSKLDDAMKYFEDNGLLLCRKCKGLYDGDEYAD